MPLPRTIHYCWFGGDEKNELTRRCIESWKRFAPDCEIVEWNEQSFDYSHNAYARQAYEAKRWSFVSDYARLVILYENGGIYFDTDVELIRPIDKLFEGGGFIGSIELMDVTGPSGELGIASTGDKQDQSGNPHRTSCCCQFSHTTPPCILLFLGSIP